MSDLRDLYQELILDHGKSPRNLRNMEAPSNEADGYNPVCGDKVHLYLLLDNGVIKDACFEGSGCAISTASASMLTQAIVGKTPGEIRHLRKEVAEMLPSEPGKSKDFRSLGKLAAFSGVCEFTNRVKGATLPWHTLDSALGDDQEIVSTE